MFSEYFDVKLEDIQKYGAIDISLVADMPMFIDPILIFNKNLIKNAKNYKIYGIIIGAGGKYENN